MNNEKRHPSDIQTISILIPVMMLVGIYLVMNGHISPGGGFQGGAALAAVIISHFLINPENTISTKSMQTLEKYIYVVFLVSATIYIIMGLYWDFPQWYTFYMVAMNILLGAKVFCGLTIIFIEFALEFK